MTRSLATLLRLRRLQTDAASRALAEAIAAETTATDHLHATRDSIRAEAAKPPPPAASPLAGAFAAWLPTARLSLSRAATTLTQAQARTEANRAALTAARAAARAASAVLEGRAETETRAALGRAQVELDERGSGGTGRKDVLF